MKKRFLAMLLPAILLLPLWLGLEGVQMAQAVADVFSLPFEPLVL